ncbi:MAG: hypothetical protein JWM86_204 [Thermoleophilia bacterium]|nr:hypothetical protein [Thermoleophilia bacterium]
MTMPRPTLRLVLAVTVLCCAALTTGSAVAPAPAARAAEGDEPARSTSEEQEQVGSELRSLADAWADGGGTFGYPFWEKAGQRWRAGQLTNTMYREYVTGYRDRLRTGCELLDSVDASTDVAGDVRRLLLDSCERRLEGLRAQQRSLGDLIAREDGSERDADELEQLDGRIAERDAEAIEALQDSYRDARIALDLAQSELDEAGIDRLAEDAFI